MIYNVFTGAGKAPRTNTPRQEVEGMDEGMSNQQLDAMLETIAKLIEADAKTPEEAAQIVRDAKPLNQKQ